VDYSGHCSPLRKTFLHEEVLGGGNVSIYVIEPMTHSQTD